MPTSYAWNSSDSHAEFVHFVDFTHQKKKVFMNSIPENFTILQHHALFLFSPIQKIGKKAHRFVRHIEGSNLQPFLQVFRPFIGVRFFRFN